MAYTKQNWNQPKTGLNSFVSVNNKTHMTCSKCGSPMTLMSGKFGKFYSCSKYPDCKNTLGHYDSPEKQAYFLSCIHTKFDSIIANKTYGVGVNEIKLDFLSDKFNMTEQCCSSLIHDVNGYTIVINQYYPFRTHFDMLEQIINKYQLTSLGFKPYIEGLSNDKKIVMQSENDFFNAISDPERKNIVAKVAQETSGVMNDIFMQVFDDVKPFSEVVNYISDKYPAPAQSPPFTNYPF